jgi:hypothetical protein
MAWKAAGALAVLVLAAPVSGAAQTVTIRTYNNFGVSPEDLAAARPHVDSIFRDAGVNVDWLDCWFRDKSVDASSVRCAQPLGTDEVILRLQAANPLPGKRYVSMGFALVNVAEGTPFLATVYADLVRVVARDAHLDYGLLLGRAIAHEIGHLLLDNNQHAQSGLMRAGWSNAELRQNAASDWTFTANEITIIRAAAAVRSGRSPAGIIASR